LVGISPSIPVTNMCSDLGELTVELLSFRITCSHGLSHSRTVSQSIDNPAKTSRWCVSSACMFDRFLSSAGAPSPSDHLVVSALASNVQPPSGCENGHHTVLDFGFPPCPPLGIQYTNVRRSLYVGSYSDSWRSPSSSKTATNLCSRSKASLSIIESVPERALIAAMVAPTSSVSIS
jgi:hypothetical protein